MLTLGWSGWIPDALGSHCVMDIDSLGNLASQEAGWTFLWIPGAPEGDYPLKIIPIEIFFP